MFQSSGTMLAAMVKPPMVARRVRSFQPAGRCVVGDASQPAGQAELMHREERQVEADEHEHELDLAEPLAQHRPVIFGNQ